MRIVFMGTPAVAVPALEALAAAGHDVAAVWTQPDRPAGRGGALSAPAVKLAAERLGVPVHQPTKVRTEEARDLLASSEPDVVVVFAYGRILPPSLLGVPPRGCVNVHTSLLPAYRGAAPIQWAIARGETVTGVTTMLMDEGLDTGDMLLRRETPIGERETAVELAGRLSQIGADLVVETLARLDEIEPTRQDDAAATLAPILTREDGRIDWSVGAREIANRCRGFQPWPGTWTTLGGVRLHVWDAEALAEPQAQPPAEPLAEPPAEPGTIVEAKGDRLVVACGASTRLLARELQPEGKRRMSARDAVNGLRLSPGVRLGVQ